MSSRRGRGPALVALALALAWIGGPVRAGESEFTLGHRPDLPPERQVHVRELTLVGSPEPGGFGAAIYDLVNRDGAVHEIAIEVLYSGGGRFEARRSIALEPGAAARVVLPIPCGDAASVRREIAIDGFVGQDATDVVSKSQQPPPAALLVGVQEPALSGCVRFLEDWRKGGKSRLKKTDEVDRAAPEDLPDSWRWLSGYDLLIADGRSPGLTAARQQVLLDHCAAGGALVVLYRGAAPRGPLAELPGPDPATAAGGVFQGELQFGRYVLLDDLEPFQVAKAAAPRSVMAWLGGSEALKGEERSGPAAESLYGTIDIPGLGKVPVRAFLLLILVFVGLVAVLAWKTLRRRAAAVTLLWKLPALGLTFAFAIVGYGIASEGFHVRGSIVSFSYLDQAAHRAVSQASRSLYAGLAPDRLAPGAGTFFASSRLDRSNSRTENPHVLALDFDAAALIGGGALPSRTPTDFVTVTVALARERLRFERDGDGGYRVVAAPEFAPLEREGSVLLRAPDGTYFAGRGGGSLALIGPDAATDVLDMQAKLLLEARGAGLAFSERSRAMLAPGSYQALVGAPPFVDDLGLDATYLESAHVVRGTLATEDLQ